MGLDHLRDARDAVAVGEHEIEQDDVGLELCGHAHGVGADRGAAEHREGAICEHGDETPPIQVVVLSDENRNPSRGVFQRAPPRVHTRESHPSEGGLQPPTSPWSWPVYPPDRGTLGRLSCAQERTDGTRTRLTVTTTSSNSSPIGASGLCTRTVARSSGCGPAACPRSARRAARSGRSACRWRSRPPGGRRRRRRRCPRADRSRSPALERGTSTRSITKRCPRALSCSCTPWWACTASPRTSIASGESRVTLQRALDRERIGRRATSCTRSRWRHRGSSRASRRPTRRRGRRRPRGR